MKSTVVLTNGVFDLFHAGHVQYLKACKELGDFLIVGVNSDASARTNKGPSRPITPENERAEIVKAIRYVDRVVVFDDPTAVSLIHKVHPDVYVKGGDYTDSWIPEFEAAEKIGAKVVMIELDPEFREARTSSLLKKILETREDIEKVVNPLFRVGSDGEWEVVGG